jgi:hypothetical protein
MARILTIDPVYTYTVINEVGKGCFRIRLGLYSVYQKN